MNMVKKVLLVMVLALCVTKSYGQVEIKVEDYKKVMSSTFANDYTDKVVSIEAEYFKDGYLKNYRKPKKLKKMYFFQCLNIGDNAKEDSFTKEFCGDFFVIEKELADKVLELQKGDKVRLTGSTFVQNYFGTEMSAFFIVKDVVKL